MRIGVGRLGDTKIVDVADGMSVLSTLRTNGFTKAENEVIQDLSGNEFDGSEEVEEGQTYLLVQRVKSGQ